MPAPSYHARSHKPNGPDPVPAHFCIQLSAEDEAPAAGDDWWRLPVEPDWAGTFLRLAEAYVRTTGSSVTRIQLHNLGNADDLLTSRIEIDSSENFSRTAATPAVVDPDMVALTLGDVIRVDMDNVGTGITGLKLMLTFGPRLIKPA